MIFVVFQPATIDVKASYGNDEDGQGRNVIHDVHKRQGSFLLDFPKVHGAIVRRVIYSFGRMILLFSSEYKDGNHTFNKERVQICHRKRECRVSYTGSGRTPGRRRR